MHKLRDGNFPVKLFRTPRSPSPLPHAAIDSDGAISNLDFRHEPVSDINLGSVSHFQT